MQNKSAICVLLLAVAGLVQGQAPSKKALPAKPAVGEPKFKAIWEPANVKEDLELLAVYFVSPDEGWVAGGKDVVDGGVILHTQDGGKSRQTELGDPQSSDRAYRDLRFLGPKLGWAVQSTGVGDHTLLHNTDGESWSASGTVGQFRSDYLFTSPEVGWMMRYRNMTYTTNGGKSWVSREIGFPETVNAFSLVRRDCGYAVGSHGMVYRFRVVPIDYTAKGMLPAPAMPAR
jgi:photosystem II stability/assembly factor-like uncharacterized protein